MCERENILTRRCRPSGMSFRVASSSSGFIRGSLPSGMMRIALLDSIADLNVRERKYFDQALPALGNVLSGGIQQLGVHPGLFAFRHDENRVAGFNCRSECAREKIF